MTRSLSLPVLTWLNHECISLRQVCRLLRRLVDRYDILSAQRKLPNENTQDVLFDDEGFTSTIMKAIRVKSYGGPEQLAYIDIARPVPQPHEALVKIDAIAVNSIQSSGSVPPFDAALLAQKGSLYLTRPSLGHCVLTREELLWRAGDVLNWITAVALKLRMEKKFPLSEAAEAHRQLEGRATGR